jgi:hypothetical protein
MQLKDLFKEYVEDYNTATMPSKKCLVRKTWPSTKRCNFLDMRMGQNLLLMPYLGE